MKWSVHVATNLCEWCFSFPSISLFATSGQSSSDERTQSHSMKIDMVGPLLSPPCKIASGPCEPLHAVANSSLAQVNDSATPTRHASLREIRGKSEQTEASPDAYWLMVLKDLQRGKKREKARTVRLANSVVLRTSVITSCNLCEGFSRRAPTGHDQSRENVSSKKSFRPASSHVGQIPLATVATPSRGRKF